MQQKDAQQSDGEQLEPNLDRLIWFMIGCVPGIAISDVFTKDLRWILAPIAGLVTMLLAVAYDY